jgi:hypothetical protein
MNTVNIVDQYRVVYARLIREYRTWKSLFTFLFRIALFNAFKL